MLIIGLTGSIATGKSTVSNRLKEQGIPVVDADLIAKHIVDKGKPAYNKIVKCFGPLSDNLLQQDGEINRQELGKLVFGPANKSNLQKLNSITHPKVGWEMILEVIKCYIKGYDMVVLDVPLLFEANFHYYCGTVINVICDEDLQLSRLLVRNPQLSESEAQKRIGSQMSMSSKSSLSNIVIENNGSLEELYASVDGIVKDIKPNKLWSTTEWFIFPFGLVVGAVRYFQNVWKYKQMKKIG